MAATRAARSVFCTRRVERLAQDLVFHRLAAERPFQFADTLLKPAHLRGADNGFVRSHGRDASLSHQPAPPKEQVRRHAVAPCHRRYGLARHEALLDNAQLLGRRPMPTAHRAGDHLDALIILGRKHVLKPVLEPSRLRQTVQSKRGAVHRFGGGARSGDVRGSQCGPGSAPPSRVQNPVRSIHPFDRMMGNARADGRSLLNQP